jgi:plasmid stabilization system protein ParE
VIRSGYRLSDRAILDLKEISDYFGTRSESAADRVLESLHDTFEAVARDHGIGTSLDHYRAGLRMSLSMRPAHNYVVFYRVADGRVLVTRVLHAARDWISSLADDQ